MGDGPGGVGAGAPASGLRLLGEGREAQIFEWGEGRVVRVLRASDVASRFELEAAAMRAASEAGAPAPRVYDLVEVDGRPGVVLDRIDGPDLLTRVASRPWTVAAAGRTLGEVHARLHAATAPADLPSMSDVIRDRLRTADVAPDELVEFALKGLEQLPDGDRLLHGDLHPANILLGPEGPVAIDWVRTGRGDSSADVAWTRLLLRVAQPHPSSPAIVRKGHAAGRGLMERAYMKAYASTGELDLARIDRWEPILAVARLATDLEGERDDLMALLARAGAPVARR